MVTTMTIVGIVGATQCHLKTSRRQRSVVLMDLTPIVTDPSPMIVTQMKMVQMQKFDPGNLERIGEPRNLPTPHMECFSLVETCRNIKCGKKCLYFLMVIPKFPISSSTPLEVFLTLGNLISERRSRGFTDILTPAPRKWDRLSPH